MTIAETLKKDKDLREFLHQFVSCGGMCTIECEGCNYDIDAIIDRICEDYDAVFVQGYKEECERLQLLKEKRESDNSWKFQIL